MNITALIPARKNSQRFPGKNYFSFLGKPLFLHSVEFARKSPLISEYFVTTNDDYIIEICLEESIPFIRRPDILSSPTATNTQYIHHFLENLKSRNLNLPKLLLVLQPTNPIRKKEFLEDMINLFKEKHAVDSVFTVTRCKSKIGNIINGNFSPFNYKFEQRSQDMKDFYQENGMFYLINVISFLRNHSFFGENNLPYEIPYYFKNIDIDTKLDFMVAEEYAKILSLEIKTKN